MPLKRSKALQPLSRQHHNGLLCCLLLKKGVKKNASAEVMAAFINHFWQLDLEHHFSVEESVLLPLASTFPLVREALSRMKKEHRELKSLIENLNQSSSPGSATQFGLDLEKHIRFEEQVLFPLVESSVSPQLLANIGAQLNDEAEKDNCMNYAIRFWE